jgi:hypothetical protein
MVLVPRANAASAGQSLLGPIRRPGVSMTNASPTCIATCRERLLDMISLEKPFSRPVLRYLRVSKRYVEWESGDDE